MARTHKAQMTYLPTYCRSLFAECLKEGFALVCGRLKQLDLRSSRTLISVVVRLDVRGVITFVSPSQCVRWAGQEYCSNELPVA